MRTILLIVSIFFYSGLFFADHHGKKMKQKVGMENRAMMTRLKLDLAELKGPPSVAEVAAKKAERLSNLDLLIASGKYEGERLRRLEMMRDKIVNQEIPSQEAINQRHEDRLKKANKKLQKGSNRQEKTRKQKRKYRKKD
jgi:small-conductance mechanosensitive channel